MELKAALSRFLWPLEAVNFDSSTLPSADTSKFIATMPALEQESQYGRFVTLSKKHGVRLTLIIAVDMPPEKP